MDCENFQAYTGSHKGREFIGKGNPNPVATMAVVIQSGGRRGEGDAANLPAEDTLGGHIVSPVRPGVQPGSA